MRRFPLLQVIVIVFLTGSLSLVTVIGNILVLVSFKINKALKTVNNYYLLSLAFADLTIGTLSMNLYTTYIIMNQWALGPAVCDLWLAIDYVASNASVMNLLVISFDRCTLCPPGSLWIHLHVNMSPKTLTLFDYLFR